MLGHPPGGFGLVDRLDALRQRVLGLGRALVGVHVGDVFGGVAGGEEHRRLAGIDIGRLGVGGRVPFSAAAMIASPSRR